MNVFPSLYLSIASYKTLICQLLNTQYSEYYSIALEISHWLIILDFIEKHVYMIIATSSANNDVQGEYIILCFYLN